MDFASHPSWLLQPSGLKDALFQSSPSLSNLGMYTSLSDSTSLISGARQFIFWRDEMAPSLTNKTIVLAFLSPQGLTFGSIPEVYHALESVCDMRALVEISQGANPNFLGLAFNNSDEIDKILHNFLCFQDNLVLHISYSSPIYCHFRLLWLPPLFNESRVHAFLKSITSTYNFKRESVVVSPTVSLPSNIVSGYLVPKKGESLSSLPHLVKLPKPHKGSALLIVSGRPSICLRCQEVGHTRRDCSMKRCTSCSKVHFPSSPCGVSSYSSVASRNVSRFSDTVWMDHLPDQTSTEVPTLPEVSTSSTKNFDAGDALNTSVLPCNDDGLAYLPDDLHSHESRLEIVEGCDPTPNNSYQVITLPSSPKNVGAKRKSPEVQSPPPSSSLVDHHTYEKKKVRTNCSSTLNLNVDDASLHATTTKIDLVFGDPDLSMCFLPSSSDSSNDTVPHGSSVSLPDLTLLSPDAPLTNISFVSSSFVASSDQCNNMNQIATSLQATPLSSHDSESSIEEDIPKRFALLVSGFPYDISDGEIDTYLDAHSTQHSVVHNCLVEQGDLTRSCLLSYDTQEMAQFDLQISLSSYNQFPISLTHVEDVSAYLSD